MLFWVRHREILVFLQTPKRYHGAGPTYSVHLDVTEYKNLPYIHDQTATRVGRRRPSNCVLGEARRKQHDITGAAPNELKPGEGG